MMRSSEIILINLFLRDLCKVKPPSLQKSTYYLINNIKNSNEKN